MKKTLTRIITMTFRGLLYGTAFQVFFLGMLLAKGSEAQVIQSVREATISVDLRNASLQECFRAIEKQTNYKFSYDHYLIDKQVRINFRARNQSVSDFLMEISKEADLKFMQINNNINVQKLEKGRNEKKLEVIIQGITITGKVTSSEDQEGLPGVNVIVKGTTQGTVTDINGNYSVEVPDEDATLVYSSVGFTQQEVIVGNRTVIDVVMMTDVTALEEIVVIGYGTARKKDLTGAVSSVSGDELQNIPASRVDQVLQGKAAGVQVTQINGAPGSGSTIRVRGGNSIQGDNEPLYVVDGFIVGTDFNLNNININDIESIEVLKDAVSISIYGTRGANGVILITTKSGSKVASTKPNISVNAYTAVQTLQSTIDLASGPELAYLSNLDAQNRGAALPFPDLDNVPDVNWVDQVTESAPLNNIDVSISGRTAENKMNYYVSGNYYNQKGIVRNSGIEKYIFRTNFDINASKKVKVGIRLNVTSLKNENNKVALASLWNDGLTARAIYNEDGTFTARNPVTAGTQRNAEADIQLRVDHEFVTNIIGTGYLQYEPIKGLIFKSTIGPKLNIYKRNRYLPGELPERLETQVGGEGIVNGNQSFDILNENTVTYAREFNENHKFDILGGFTWQKYQLESYYSGTEGFANDVVQYNNLSLGDPARNEVNSDYNSFQLVSWLGRANYTLMNKYLVTLVGRVDGSSRFAGSNNEYAFFPSAAVAWRLYEEPWIQNMNVFDDLKLRGSYGIAGSQAIGSYRTLAVLDPTSMFFNGMEQPGVRNGRPASPELKWETTTQIDIGLEAAFFGSRLSFEIDYYKKRTEDLLLNVEIPRQTGFSTKLQNLGEVQNQGLELMINTVNIQKPNFTWETSLTISGNRSKVLDIGDAEYINIASPTNQGGPGGRLIVGETVPVFVGVEYQGVWKSQEEIDASGIKNQLVGGPKFKDTDGDLVISENDFEPIGSPEPDFFGGMMNTIGFKNFTLDFYFNWSYGNDLYNSLSHQAFFFREGSNSYAELVNHWSPENPDSDIPMPGTSQSLANIKSNTRLIEDGSYLRFKSVRLSYALPRTIMNKITWMENLELYFNGTNLLLFSQNKLFDPEVSRYGTSSTAIGFTNGEYPYARTLLFGVKLDF